MTHFFLSYLVRYPTFLSKHSLIHFEKYLSCPRLSFISFVFTAFSLNFPSVILFTVLMSNFPNFLMVLSDIMSIFLFCLSTTILCKSLCFLFVSLSFLLAFVIICTVFQFEPLILSFLCIMSFLFFLCSLSILAFYLLSCTPITLSVAVAALKPLLVVLYICGCYNCLSCTQLFLIFSCLH